MGRQTTGTKGFFISILVIHCRRMSNTRMQRICPEIIGLEILGPSIPSLTLCDASILTLSLNERYRGPKYAPQYNRGLYVRRPTTCINDPIFSLVSAYRIARVRSGLSRHTIYLLIFVITFIVYIVYQQTQYQYKLHNCTQYSNSKHKCSYSDFSNVIAQNMAAVDHN